MTENSEDVGDKGISETSKDIERKNDGYSRSEGSFSTDSDDLDEVYKFSFKSTNEQYIDYRETSKTLMYLIDNRDREKVSNWIDKLDSTIGTEECQLERLQYAKYLVATLSGPYGLVEPFTSMPPDSIKPLHLVLPPIVYTDLLDDQPTSYRSRRKGIGRKTTTTKAMSILQDYKFAEQQLFPPEGLMCYAAAFSSEP